MHFDLVDIKLLVNVAETRGVTRGAERSNMSAPAASVRIKTVEDRLGTKLLYRTKTGVDLTPSGTTFVRHGRMIIEQLEQLNRDLEAYVRGTKGLVRVCSDSVVMAEFLPLVIRNYLAKHPSVDVQLRQGSSHDAMRAVVGGTADIGIVAAADEANGLETLPYRRERLVLVASASHPLSRRRTVRFEETSEFEYVGCIDGNGIDTFLTHTGLTLGPRSKRCIQVPNIETLCRMVEANAGIGIVPESSAVRYAKILSIRVVRLSDPWAVRQFHVCVRKLGTLSASSRNFVTFLISDANDRAA